MVAAATDVLPSAAVDSADILTRGEKEALRRAFRRLRPAQRELLWWRYIEGWTPTQIARLKLEGAVPDNHVKVYVARAVSKLAAVYEDEQRRVPDE
jgi:DNA-directed RNA polymerase specialized sigma24 family protein